MIRLKFCPQCGEKNPDNAKFCESCGTNLEKISPAQHNTYKKEKNTLIAPLINFLLGLILYCLCGIGHILYLHLRKRGIILCAIGLLISVIFGIMIVFNNTLILTAISLVIGTALAIYSAYDAYKCTKAINEGSDLPLLFGTINPENLSRGKMIGVGVICVVGLVALAASIVIAAEAELSEPTDAANFIENSDNVVQKHEGVQIKITYPYAWSAHIGDSNDTNHYEGVGDKTFEIDESDYDVIAAAVSKKDSNSDELKVEGIKDGTVVDMESTTKNYGTVSVSTIID